MIQTTLKIEGMMCHMCEAHVNEAIRNHFDVKKVQSSAKDKETVIVSNEALDEAEITAVIAETGYELKGIETKPYEKKGLFG